MGLRVEQQNIEDLLKYFVARNEFGRRNLVEKLKDLSDEELVKLNITNYAEFYNYYKFLYKVLKQDIIEGTKTTVKNSRELIGRSYYTEDFLLKYPFQYILDLRLAKSVTKEYTIVFSTRDNYWRFSDTNEIVELAEYGISIDGSLDTVTIKYIANPENVNVVFEQNEEETISVVVNASVFGKKVKSKLSYSYTDEDSVDDLFNKIVDSNPELLSVYENTMLISPEYEIYNNSEVKCKLDDLFTFTGEIYYMSDKDVEGLTEKTKAAIILACARKILEERSVAYKETDYLKNVVYDNSNNIKSYDLSTTVLVKLVLDSNPIYNNAAGFKEETFRTLQSEMTSLKAYINDYVINETSYSENKYFMKNGKANYSGYSLPTVIPHNTGLKPATVIVNNVNPENIEDIGDVYIDSDTKNIYVYNTGKNRSEFEFNAIFDNGVYLEFPKDKSFEDFIDISINGINKVKLDKSLITSNDDGRINIRLVDIDNTPLFSKFDFLIITDKDTKKDFYYRVDDKELFSYNEETNTLTVISDDVAANLDDTYYITAMEIDDGPIMYLLTKLMMSPNFYIQEIMNFSNLLYIPTDEEYVEYEKVLGKSTIDFIKQNNTSRFIDLTSYNVNDSDILFINGLSYSLIDKSHFNLFYIMNEDSIDRRILAIYNFNVDSLDEVCLSRLTTIVNPFEFEKENDPNSPSYYFDKYVYLANNSSFGRGRFKTDLIPIKEEPEDDLYYLDSSSRLFNEYPLTNRIEDLDIGYGNADEYTDRTLKQVKYAIISHKLGKTPNFVNINPYTSNIDEDEAKFIGNIWWEVDSENLYVYNDGNSTCEFDWYVTYDENCKVENHKYTDDVLFEKEKYLFYNIAHNTDTKLEYYGNDYIEYNKYEKKINVHNTNKNNVSYGYKFSYITGKHVDNKRFLEYSEGFTYNQDGYFDRNAEIQPTGEKVLNYSGELRATKARVYGNGIVQYLPVSSFDTFDVGFIVSYVNGECKITNSENADTLIGVVAADSDAGLAIDNYHISKVPVAMFGIHDVKVLGKVKAGEKLYLATNIVGLEGVAMTMSSAVSEEYYIGKALEDHNLNNGDVGIIKVLIGIS